MYAEAQLRKVPGWSKVVTITNAKENGEMTDFAKRCGVTATPTLVALTNGEVVATMSGSQDMTTDFWRATVEKHGNV
jgi:hypothetical protein